MNEVEIFCGSFPFWCACVSHICNLLCNIFLDKYGLSSNSFYTLPSPLNGLQKGKYTPNTELIQKQSWCELRVV